MARSIELNEKMKDERRAKILQGSLKLFAIRGLAASKISDIAKECKMSQGLVYHYYSSKDEIFIELIDDAFNKLIDACNWLNKQDIGPGEKISMAIEKIIEMIVEDSAFAYNSLLIAQASVNSAIPEAAKKIIIEKNRIPYEIIEEIFKKGIEIKEISGGKAEEMATLFWTTINGLAIYKSSHGERSSLPSIAFLKRVLINKIG